MKNKLVYASATSKGPDDIHPSVLRNCAQAAALPLTIIYKKSLEEGILPRHWKMAVVVPIFKKRQQARSQ